MLRKYDNFRTSGPVFTQVQSEFAKMIQNMTLRLEHMEVVFFDQNMTLQISFFSIWRLCSTLRSKHHPSNLTLVFPLFDQNITKPQNLILNSLLHCYRTVLHLAATTFQITYDPVHACAFSNPIFTPN